MVRWLVVLVAISLNLSCDQKLLFKSNLGSYSVGNVPKAETWSFAESSRYTYDSNYVAILDGVASLSTVANTHNSSSLFSGTNIATRYSSGLTLDPDSADATSLESTWVSTQSALAGHWKLENDWTDSSGNGTTLSTSGSPVFSSTEVRVGSYSAVFDTTDDIAYIKTPSFQNLSKGSIAFWFKLTDFSAGQDDVLLSLASYSGSTDEFSINYLGSGDDQLQIRVIVAATTSLDLRTTDNTIRDDLWHHFVLTSDGATLRLYLDGQLQEVSTVSGSNDGQFFAAFDSGNDYFSIGARAKNSSFDKLFGGNLDEVAIWSEVLSAEEISLIYSRQQFKNSGIYTSQIIDTGTTDSDWSVLSWSSSLPFAKPLTSATESTEVYAGVSSTLMDDLIVYYRFDEASYNGTDDEVVDSSGNAHHSKLGGTAISTNAQGLFGRAFDGSASGDSCVLFKNDTTTGVLFNDSQTTSFWIKSNASLTDGRTRFTGSVSNIGVTYDSDSGTGDNRFVYRIYDSSSTLAERYADSTGLAGQEWIHVVASHGASGVQLYLNGVKQSAIALNGSYNGSFRTGSTDTGIFGNRANCLASFDGLMDEFAAWSRQLTDAEVLQLYQRGATLSQFQVRSCDDAACSGESWIGPGGDGSTWFSEYMNNSTVSVASCGSDNICQLNEIGVTGETNTSAPSFTHGNFVNAPSSNRYFQYRVLMASNDQNTACSSAMCVPDLTSISFSSSSSQYYAGSPSIVTPVSSNSFTSLSGFSVSTTDFCDPKFQISSDGSTFYYWNGSAWAVASDSVDQSSTAAQMNTNLPTLSISASTQVYLRAYLPSTGSSSCQIDSITITGQG